MTDFTDFLDRRQDEIAALKRREIGSDRDLRFRCLEMAMRGADSDSAEEVLARAGSYYAFVADEPQQIAGLRAELEVERSKNAACSCLIDRLKDEPRGG